MNMAISFYNNGFEGSATSTPAFISCFLHSNTSLPTHFFPHSFSISLPSSPTPSLSLSLPHPLLLYLPHSFSIYLPSSLHPFSSSGMLDSLLSRVGEVCVHFVVMVAVPIVLTHLQITNGQQLSTLSRQNLHPNSLLLLLILCQSLTRCFCWLFVGYFYLS